MGYIHTYIQDIHTGYMTYIHTYGTYSGIHTYIQTYDVIHTRYMSVHIIHRGTVRRYVHTGYIHVIHTYIRYMTYMGQYIHTYIHTVHTVHTYIRFATSKVQIAEKPGAPHGCGLVAGQCDQRPNQSPMRMPAEKMASLSMQSIGSFYIHIIHTYIRYIHTVYIHTLHT